MPQDDDKIGQELLNHILLEYAPLINLHAKKLKNEGLIPEGIDHNDLHVEGFKGLVDALHKYDPKLATNPNSKNPFAAYAQHRIRGKMLDHIASNDPVPKHVRYAAKQMRPKPEVTQVSATPAASAVPKIPTGE